MLEVFRFNYKACKVKENDKDTKDKIVNVSFQNFILLNIEANIDFEELIKLNVELGSKEDISSVVKTKVNVKKDVKSSI